MAAGHVSRGSGGEPACARAYERHAPHPLAPPDPLAQRGPARPRARRPRAPPCPAALAVVGLLLAWPRLAPRPPDVPAGTPLAVAGRGSREVPRQVRPAAPRG